MRSAGWLYFVLLNIFIQRIFAEDISLNKGMDYSLNTGSFIFHAYAPNQKFNQYFHNQFVAIEKSVSHSIIDNYVVGTFLNSYDDRCILLGVQKNWINFHNKLSFEGLYAYAGEFFIDAFSECGASGLYNDMLRATGIGFVPYIYHGIEYDLDPHISLEAGALLPGILVLSVQWHF